MLLVVSNLVDDPRLWAWLNNPSPRNHDALVEAIKSGLKR